MTVFAEVDRMSPAPFFVARNSRYVRAFLWACGCAALLQPLIGASTQAQQRDAQQKIGATVADRESPHYRFERFTVSSADGLRTWRIQLGIPRTVAPAGGFPSFWMMDGNAALAEFDADLLEDLAKQPVPQVLVFLGHDNDLRIDSPARTRDYTPQLTPPEEPGAAPQEFTGGAPAFLEIVERKIRPEVAQRVPLNLQQQALWGHSYGGLFALHTLFTRTGAFQVYAASSPSLWWKQGYALREADQFIAHNAGHPARVLIHLGGSERVGDFGPRDLNDPRVAAHMARVRSVPPDSAPKLAERLKEVPGLEVTYREFPGLGHGPMLRASLLGSLHAIAGVADRSASPRTPPPAGN